MQGAQQDLIETESRTNVNETRDYSFNKFSNLKKHKLIHSGENPRKSGVMIVVILLNNNGSFLAFVIELNSIAGVIF